MNEEDEPEDADEEDSRGPHEDVSRHRESGDDGPPERSFEFPEFTGGKELVNGLVTLGRREHPDNRQQRDGHEQSFGDLVVGEAGDAPREERSRRQCEEGDGDDTAEATAEALSEEVQRNRTQDAKDGRREDEHGIDGSL